MARHTQKFVSYLPSTAPQDKTRGLQMIIIDFFLEKKSFPFNLFLPFPPLSPWKWGQRQQGALREPAAENESSHLEISAENYKLLHKDQLSLGPYSL